MAADQPTQTQTSGAASAAPKAESPARKAPRPSASGPSGLDRYYNASNLRTDLWDQLKRGADNLSRARKAGRGTETTAAKVEAAMDQLEPIEFYWAFPGKRTLADLRQLLAKKSYNSLAAKTAKIVRLLSSGSYRRRDTEALRRRAAVEEEPRSEQGESFSLGLPPESRPYAEVLVVDQLDDEEEQELRSSLRELRRDEDEFVYDVVIVPSFEDALIAVLFNYNIQSCVLRYDVPFRSERRLDVLHSYLAALGPHRLDESIGGESTPALGRMLKALRPELDLFLVTDTPVEEITGSGKLPFRRVFYRQEDYPELHVNILKGIAERYQTPFFQAVKSHSRKPTGVFHAMPLSRGKSIARSNWIQDLGRFYGANIFLAETSATTGGLDSLLQPQGALRDAQELAARAFGARRSYFVTNGTSTANKIVSHALIRPGDIVLCSRDCHKSHHYALQLAGGLPVYMDPYPLSRYSMYGAIPLRQIKQHLIDLRRDGKLDRVRMIMLTNCTFDGLTYNPERVMEEVLAIKPDMIFLWDEAWFAFARFNPTLRRRTAMHTAQLLRDRFRSPAHRERFARFAGEQWKDDDPRWLDGSPVVDPERVRLRVYATQSTHKTLTSLRQGSMIHVWDQDFEQRASEAFQSAYMTYTSTSPNYQILASLDAGRRQVEFEGYELVQKSIEYAMTLRRKIKSHPLLARYFNVLGPADLIPEDYRPSKLDTYYGQDQGWNAMEEAWIGDEFALDPTRVTLEVGAAGMDGDTFKKHLIDRHDIQINKTSRNTVLFMVHIGTSRGAMAHLVEVLVRIAEEIEEELEDQNPAEKSLFERKVRSLTVELPPLPNFSHFHDVFREAGSSTREGDMRSASFLAYDPENCEYLSLDGEVEQAMDAGRDVVSAGFVTPYPPGFPVLVPGQVMSRDILHYLRALDVKEIHGYKPEYGLRIFTEEALEKQARSAPRH
ncbi:MAG: ornithine decarboxylase [Acidobacteria bacterium]|nr:MAG: ornithine decarboxylase [Acidobacteriota bacterium]REK03805.1 MAG: ornithine decarboxylase [Acidobacteriota bacterium]